MGPHPVMLQAGKQLELPGAVAEVFLVDADRDECGSLVAIMERVVAAHTKHQRRGVPYRIGVLQPRAKPGMLTIDRRFEQAEAPESWRGNAIAGLSEVRDQDVINPENLFDGQRLGALAHLN